MEQAQITDAGITVIEAMPRLSYLNVSWCRALSDESLTVIGRRTELTWLSLDGTSISDEEMRHLRHLTTLAVLFIASTQVTADGLAHLPLTTHPSGWSTATARPGD